MSGPRLGIGVVGCGSISGIYLQNLRDADTVEVVACADLLPDRALHQAEAHGIPRVLDTEALIADPGVDIVLNLTTPPIHAPIARAAVEAGKHVYNEKPLTIDLDDADRLLDAAAARGVRVGCAPDTFLGAGLTTCRDLLRAGAIGRPVGGDACFTCPGHERWHPDPCFYYQRGGGPMLDMGPYYVTALVTLLGPVRRVTGSARRTEPVRMITSEPRRGQTIDVEVPTHVGAVLDFVDGALVCLTMSFDVEATRRPPIEIYGSAGTLAVPDPNMFDGPVERFDPGTGLWCNKDLVEGPTANSRGLGVIDMAVAILAGDDRPHLASGELARHVLEIMCGIVAASESGRHVDIASGWSPPSGW